MLFFLNYRERLYIKETEMTKKTDDLSWRTLVVMEL